MKSDMKISKDFWRNSSEFRSKAIDKFYRPLFFASIYLYFLHYLILGGSLYRPRKIMDKNTFYKIKNNYFIFLAGGFDSIPANFLDGGDYW